MITPSETLSNEVRDMDYDELYEVIEAIANAIESRLDDGNPRDLFECCEELHCALRRLKPYA